MGGGWNRGEGDGGRDGRCTGSTSCCSWPCATEQGGNHARLMLRSSGNSLLIPGIWELFASPGGFEESPRSQGCKKIPPHPGITGKTWGIDSQPCPRQEHGEMDVKNNSCDYSEWDFGSLTNSSPAAGSGSPESLQQEHKANEIHPQCGVLIPKPFRRARPS